MTEPADQATGIIHAAYALTSAASELQRLALTVQSGLRPLPLDDQIVGALVEAVRTVATGEAALRRASGDPAGASLLDQLAAACTTFVKDWS